MRLRGQPAGSITMSIEPPYIENLIALIEGQIADGTLRSGDRLPTIPQLHEMYGPSISTVRVALRELVARKKIRSHPGVGFYVI